MQEREDDPRAGGRASRADPVHRGAAAEAVARRLGQGALPQDARRPPHLQRLEVSLWDILVTMTRSVQVVSSSPTNACGDWLVNVAVLITKSKIVDYF